MAIRGSIFISEDGKAENPTAFQNQVDRTINYKVPYRYALYTQGSQKDANREAIVLFADKNKDFDNISDFSVAANLLAAEKRDPIRVGSLRISFIPLSVVIPG